MAVFDRVVDCSRHFGTVRDGRSPLLSDEVAPCRAARMNRASILLFPSPFCERRFRSAFTCSAMANTMCKAIICCWNLSESHHAGRLIGVEDRT